MLENEDRNCNCSYNNTMNINNANMMQDNDNNCCCEKGMAPKVPVYSYEFTNIEPEETCPEKKETKEEMLQKIRCLDFSIVELAEYLDTHPDDEKALCLHKKYSNELRELKDKYQKVFGPLSIKFPCNKWRWVEDKWPWERGNF